MTIRYRPMQPKDAQACAAIVARHPEHGARYGDSIRHLAPAWLKLLGSDGFVSAVFEELQGAKPTILGAGIATFVSDNFIRELKSAPHFWIGPEITLRLSRAESPVLSDRQVREANTFGGLNVAVWQTGVLPEDMLRGNVANTIMAAFVELYSGFLLKETVTQAETREQGEACGAAGGLLWDHHGGRYRSFAGVSVQNLLSQPHVIGLSRDLALRSSGSWNASMFLSYRPPRVGFSRSEQKLLLHGLNGGTDQEIGRNLGVSLAAVRKSWRLIYERVAATAPEILSNVMQRDGKSHERGKEKKHHLLAYLREHLEELRPVSRRLLKGRGPGARARRPR
jgi:hypothetical protein